MKCIECDSEAVYDNGIETTAMYFQPFIDDNGKTHIHDQNIKHQHFECSNGHKWVERVFSECWRGWKYLYLSTRETDCDLAEIILSDSSDYQTRSTLSG